MVRECSVLPSEFQELLLTRLAKYKNSGCSEEQLLQWADVATKDFTDLMLFSEGKAEICCVDGQIEIVSDEYKKAVNMLSVCKIEE